MAQTLTDDELPFKEGSSGEKTPLFMHEGTFADNSGWGWARDNVEIEAAFTLTGIEGRELYDLLIGDGRENYERTQAGQNWRGGERGRAYDRRRDQEIFSMDAFSVGYAGNMDLEEVPWGAGHHAIREGFLPGQDGTPFVQPYVWITIERGNFEIARRNGELDPRWGGRRRIDLGEDTMEDHYFDTDDFALLSGDMTVRSRKRFRDVTDLRRVLIALKLDRGVDEFGIKQAAKVDIRESSVSTEQLAALEEAVRTGHSSWTETPPIPLRRAWTYLKDRNRLQSSPTYKNVLAIKPMAFIRSFRARFHFNECSLSSVVEVYTNGRARLESLRAMTTEALADNAIAPSQRARAEAWNAKARALLDGSLIAERSFERLKDLGFEASVASIASLMPAGPDSVRPGRGRSVEDIAERHNGIEQRRALAETISELYHELAADLDDGSSESLRRVITRSLDRDLERTAERFVAWQKAINMEELGRLHGMDRLVEIHETMLGDAQALADFNAYGDQEWNSWETLNATQFDDLRFHLRNEQVRIWMRQIEEAGSAARGIWFDEAREFYVPASSRVAGSNFLIDTIDFPVMYDADVWGDTPPLERLPSTDLDQPRFREHLIHAALVNEVQIELTSAGARYPLRLRELRSMVDLPRFFMKWADTEGATSEADYKRIFDELIALPKDQDGKDTELQTRITPINELIEASGGRVLNYSAEEFREWLDPSRLTQEVKDDSYELEGMDVALEGAGFVFQSYKDMLTFLAKLKQPRVLRVLERAGAPNTIAWGPSTASKGQMALQRVRDAAGGGTPGTGGGGGLIDIITGNTTSGTAATVQRKDYPDRKIGSDVDEWFKIELAPGETARFTIDFDHSAGDLDMELYRDEGGSIQSWTKSESVSNEEAVEYTTTSGRTVWVRVYGYQSAEGAYNLRVE